MVLVSHHTAQYGGRIERWGVLGQGWATSRYPYRKFL
jgi:hypothetical protein